jgi:GTPase SAR1 family protein
MMKINSTKVIDVVGTAHPTTGLILMTTQLPHLQTALELLEISADSSITIDLNTAADRLTRSNYQIAVFGAFNHGKSTLLNAILGDKTLPIDLIPTTGGAIKVVYGEEIRTTITLNSGEIVSQLGSELLTEFAILDDDRRMRDDIQKIEVSYPHPLLQMGVELIDLPGTNDRAEQDIFVRSQILAADLVIYVLDTRKLMTLAEREHLRDWLEQRGMKTVVFVANFMNMLEPEERQHVQQRLRFVAESFRSQIPAGISNLYQVDALPALRARLKGDDNLLHGSGLPMFVSALQMIFESQQNEVINLRQQLLPPIATQITGLLQEKIVLLTQEVENLTAKQVKEIQLKEHAKKLIQAGWEQSLQDLERWLHLPTLIKTYQVTMVLALQQAGFLDWEQAQVMTKLQNYQVEVNNWLLKLSDFFDNIPSTEPLHLTCPEPPEVELVGATASNVDQMTPTAIATGLGWVFGGPIGAAVVGGASILANKVGGDKSVADRRSSADLTAYVEATEDYLCRLNMETIANIKDYRSRAKLSIYCPTVTPQLIESPQGQKLALLQTCLINLQ